MITKSFSRRKFVFNKFGGKCAYCGQDLVYESFQIDHIKPKFLGGKEDLENVNPSCHHCNNLKGKHTLEAFREVLKEILNDDKKLFAGAKLKKVIYLKYSIVRISDWDGVFYFEKHDIVENNNGTI